MVSTMTIGAPYEYPSQQSILQVSYRIQNQGITLYPVLCWQLSQVQLVLAHFELDTDKVTVSQKQIVK